LGSNRQFSTSVHARPEHCRKLRSVIIETAGASSTGVVYVAPDFTGDREARVASIQVNQAPSEPSQQVDVDHKLPLRRRAGFAENVGLAVAIDDHGAQEKTFES